MKQLPILSLLIFALFFLPACKKLAELTKFKITKNSELTIPATTIVNVPIAIQSPVITLGSSAEFQSHKTNSDLIQSINLEQMTLSVKSPTGGNLNFLKSISVAIEADSLSSITIASKDNIANGLDSLNLDINNVDIKEYIIKDNFKLNVSVSTDEVISQNYTLDIFNSFLVDAKILGN